MENQEKEYLIKGSEAKASHRQLTARNRLFIIIATACLTVLLVKIITPDFFSLEQLQMDPDDVARDRKLWFLTDRFDIDTKQFNKENRKLLFPEQTKADRIINQLTYIPPGYSPNSAKVKKIFIVEGPGDGFGLRLGSDSFQHCPVRSCYVSNDDTQMNDCDAFILNENSPIPVIKRKPEHVFIFYSMESPFNSAGLLRNSYNWTITYRLDSDIPVPFGKWVYHDLKVTKNPNRYQVDSSLPKKRTAAVILNECDDFNGRFRLIRQLQKLIDVDIYGVCGTTICPKDPKKCWEHLERNYKFYLSFEDSNCKDYITQKNFFDALNYDLVPVVLGPSIENYLHYAPKNSFIHVNDFPTNEKLAAHLKKVAKNPTLYESYFQWKGTGDFVDTHYPCRLCAMLHNPKKIIKTYGDIKVWWMNKDTTCKKTRWQNEIEWVNVVDFYGNT